jgi:hypothetical protein
MIVHHINVALFAPSLLMRKNSHTQKQKIQKNNARTSINTNYFAEAENGTLLLFVNVTQEEYDSSSKQVK